MSNKFARTRVIEKVWEGKTEPFKIADNLYFVGCYQASTHLIDTGDGLIVIDPGYSSSFYLVIDAIYKLGYKPEQIRYIVNTHWHGDHTEATAALADLSGAKTLLGEDDVLKAKKYFTPDIIVRDGDTLALGNIKMDFLHTPGHTKGTISLFFNITENGKIYRVGMFGGAGANTLVPARYDFDGCREAYRESLHRLMKERVDIFIGNHVWNNDTFGRAAKIADGEPNPFIDSEIWGEFLAFCESRLDRVIAENP